MSSSKLTKNLHTSATVLGIVLCVVLVALGIRYRVFVDPEVLQRVVGRGGVFSPLIFILIQVLQVVFPFIPGGLTCVAGVLLFGPVWGFVWNYLSIVCGSCINFGLAKRYGRPFVQKISSEKMWDKYFKWLDWPKFDFYFALAIFFPVAPDDFLCYLAGLTKMPFRKFFWIMILGKPAALLVYSWGLSEILEWAAKLFG